MIKMNGKKDDFPSRFRRTAMNKRTWGVSAITTLLIVCVLGWTSSTSADSSLVILPGEFPINTYTDGDQQGSDVAMNSVGRFVVTWYSLDQDGSSWGVFARIYSPLGIPVVDEFQVNTYTTGSQSVPSVAIDDAGNFVIAWSSRGQDGSVESVYAQRYNFEGLAQGDEFQVNTYTQGTQFYPQVAMDADGDFVVVWSCVTDEVLEEGIKARRFEADGTPVADEFLVYSISVEGYNYPDVAMSADGGFIIVWDQLDAWDDGKGVLGRLYDADGLAQGDPFQVNTFTAGIQSSASVDMDSTGRFVVAWESMDQDGDNYGVFGQIFNNLAEPQGPEFQINTYTVNQQVLPSIAMDENGGFVVVWRSVEQDGSHNGVFGARFDSSRVQVGDEFPINIYTLSSQNEPAAAMSPDGLFVVTWSSAGQDGGPDDYGIFGRLFECVVHEDCADDNVCTINFCDSIGMCRQLNNSMPCEDDVFCNGGDTCFEGDCTIHAGDPCDDNGLYCDGDESCDEGAGQCLSSGDPCLDNGLFCDGDEVCLEDTDECTSIGDPCLEDETCDEETDACNPLADDDADDDVNDDVDDDVNDDLNDDVNDDVDDDVVDDDTGDADAIASDRDDDDDDDDGCCGC
jgi:hypothetical protein